MKMSDSTCCVCFKEDAVIPLASTDSNNVTISSKLQSVVSEVQWKDTFSICPKCLKTLDVVLEFKNLCLKSSSFRIDQEESSSVIDSKENIHDQGESSSEEEIVKGIQTENSDESLETNNSEKTIAVTCEICKIQLNSREHLYSHNQEIHKSHRPYSCQYCNKSFCSKNRVQLHENNHVNTLEENCDSPYDCKKCNKKFTTKCQYEKHKKLHNTFICFHCNKSYRSKVMLTKHIKVKHEVGRIECGNTNNGDILMKEKVHGNDENKLSEIVKLFKCDRCDNSYETEKLMINHFKTCDEVKLHSTFDFTKYKCEKCDRVYMEEKLLKVHIKNCHGRLEAEVDDGIMNCFLCSVAFSTDKEKFEHVLNDHGIDLCSENYCRYCYKEFLNPEECQNHLMEIHSNNIERTRKHKKIAERSYSCEVCTKIFRYVKEVIEHCVNEHQMDSKLVKPYLCDKCDTRFTTSANMIQHKQYHDGNRSHICSFCGKSYITKSDLIVHEYTHLNKRNYKCEICSRAFNTNKNLRSHKLVVHTESNLWKYHCDVCSKRFPLKSGYDQHVRRHAGDKRYQCVICEKSFISSTELRKHMAFHSNVRAFKCTHCDKEYKDRRVCEIHLTKVHGIGNAKIPVRVKRFACHVCPSTFFDKQKLARHLCTHTGIKPYPCTVCDKRFTDKSYLKHHLKVSHNVVEVRESL